jgi:Flp pilus assembly protein TadD
LVIEGATTSMGLGIELDQAEALMNEGSIPEAIAILSKVVSKRPKESRALHMLGVANAMTGQHCEAEELLQKAKALKPQSVRIMTDLAVVLVMTSHDLDALALLEKVRKRDPDLRLAIFYTGVVLTNLGRNIEALDIFQQLVGIEPENAVYQQNYATVLGKLGRFDEAEPIVDRLLAKSAATTEALLVKSFAALDRECFSEALAICDRIIARDPDNAEAIYNRGQIKLLNGELIAGWPDYEARLKRNGSRVQPAYDDVPHWTGESLQGRSLLVYCEQGLGDMLLIGRYLPLLADLGAEVFFLVPGPMVQMLRSVSDRVNCVDKIPQGRKVDYQIAMLSLPYRFRTNLTTIPATVPYLFADAEKVNYWGNVVGNDGFKIGIAWQGNPAFKADLARSIPLRAFYPLAQIPGVRLISLQKIHGLDQIANLPGDMNVETLDSSGSDGFVDTAAVMKNMDLIISSDTAVANLAGALGLPGWIAVRRIPDWRWMLGSDESPWFPTLKLYRQGKSEGWQEVFQRMTDRIKLAMSSHSLSREIG